MSASDTPRTDAAEFKAVDPDWLGTLVVRSDFARTLERDLAAKDQVIVELAAACKEASKLAWEVGCETEDGVYTLLDDSRGDLYRQLTVALAKAERK